MYKEKNKETNRRRKDIFLIVTGILCILYFIFTYMSTGFMLFVFLYLIVGLLFTGYGAYELYIQKNLLSSLSKAVKRILIFLCVTGILIFGMLEVLIISTSLNTADQKSDVVIILGAGIRGRTITHTLQLRLDRAITYHEQYPDTYFIVSGGKGPGEDITEAQAMKAYLIDAGIDERNIFEEDQSRNTAQNFSFSKQLMHEKGIETENLGIITSGFHMFRSQFLAERQGLQTLAYPAPSSMGQIPIDYIREAFAIIKSFLFD